MWFLFCLRMAVLFLCGCWTRGGEVVLSQGVLSRVVVDPGCPSYATLYSTHASAFPG